MIDEKKLIEALKDVEVAWYMDGNYSTYDSTTIMDIIDEQPKVGEWIPCSEWTPVVENLHEKRLEECKSYLVQRRCGVMDVAHYIKVYGESYFSSHGMEIADVIAWMPLPERYVE